MSRSKKNKNMHTIPKSGAIATPKATGSTASLESTLKHVEIGYKNAQDIIKFLDTKSGVIAGFAFAGIGFILQSLKEIIALKDPVKSALLSMFGQYSYPTCLLFSATIVSLFAGVASIWCVVRCVTARPPEKVSKLQHTFLFPFCDKISAAQEYYKRIHTGIDLAGVADEYEHQILNVGSITCKKITWNRRAANFFLVELILLVIAVASGLTQILTFAH